MGSYFIKNGNTYSIAAEESLDLHKVLPVGNYIIKINPMTNALYLEMVDPLITSQKIYGDTMRNAKRILNTFNSRENSTGVLLNGEKGSGKTLLAKVISVEGAKEGIPTIIINNAFHGDGFNKFVQDIEQSCIFLFDEFEKVYDEDSQEQILTLFDGVFSSKKLFILTVNDKWKVNQHMRNRPGRIYYLLEFSGIEADFIREYCEDNLNNKQHIDKIVVVASLFDKFNFDMLKALVEEMNRYDETPQEALKILNAKPEYSNRGSFNIELTVRGTKLTPETCGGFDPKWSGNPLVQDINIDFKLSKKGDKWERVIFTANDLKSVDSINGSFHYVCADKSELLLTREKLESYSYRMDKFLDV